MASESRLSDEHWLRLEDLGRKAFIAADAIYEDETDGDESVTLKTMWKEVTEAAKGKPVVSKAQFDRACFRWVGKAVNEPPDHVSKEVKENLKDFAKLGKKFLMSARKLGDREIDQIAQNARKDDEDDEGVDGEDIDKEHLCLVTDLGNRVEEFIAAVAFVMPYVEGAAKNADVPRGRPSNGAKIHALKELMLIWKWASGKGDLGEGFIHLAQAAMPAAFPGNARNLKKLIVAARAELRESERSIESFSISYLQTDP